MEKIKIPLKAFIIMVLIITFLIPIFLINIIFIKPKKDNLNKNIISNENIIEPEISENMKEITITSGLNAGSKNKQKMLLKNDEFFVSIDVLENILGDNVKITYNESENIIKAFVNIANFEEENTFLIIDLENGIMKGKRRDGTKLEDEKMKVLPIIQGETILLPMKCILNRVNGILKMYYEKELELIRLKLEDFELNFLNDFPYDVLGSYVSNSVVSYYQATNVSKTGVIYIKDNKYGLVTYNVEEYMDNSIPRGRYLGYNIELEAIYDNIVFVPYDYNIYILKKGNKSLIYSINDKTLSEEYDLVEEIKNGEHDYKIKKNGKYGLYGVSEIIYDDIWYEEGKTTGTDTRYTEQGIYGLLNGEKILIKELRPSELVVDLVD